METNNHVILNLRNVTYAYNNERNVLNGISMRIEKGYKLALMGENGSGKSTLMQTFNGLLKPSEGLIELNGEPVVYSKKGLMKWRSMVGVVMQDVDSQLFAPSVYAELAFGPSNMGLSHGEIENRVNHIAQCLNLTSLLLSAPHQLSYGQKKRVVLGAYLTMLPDLLVLDEPFTGLDYRHEVQLRQLLDLLHLSGTTLVVSTHDSNFALEWANQLAIIHQGQLVAVGNPSEVMGHFSLMEKWGLSVPNIL
jgi:cobalt/nickel transport system ATP-binding protein